jgi:GH35 family endo-1,4-beta-xylanase
VINEPVHEHDLIDLCGKDVMVEWFKAAREADPAPKLNINEYGILSGGGADTGTQDAYEGIIRYLLDNGAPLDGIGMQSHLGQTLTDPERILSVLDRFGKFGKEIRITEFDFDVPDDDELRYDYMKDTLIAVFSHPSVTGFYMWGFWDGAQWLKMGPLYALDWTLKSSGKAWREMLYKEWWTRAAGKTDGKGRYSTRGFLGDYDVEVSFGGKRQTVKTALDSSGRSLSVVLK